MDQRVGVVGGALVSRSWRSRGTVVALLLVLVWLLAGSGSAHAQVSSALAVGSQISAATAQVPQSVDDLRKLEDRVRQVSDRVLAATVAVQVGIGRQQAHGSGVIVSADGFVLTAAHVAWEPNRRVSFRLPDGRRARGVSLGLNQEIDMGLMKIEDPGPWPFIQPAKSEEVKPGDWCLATGYPGGFDADQQPALRLGRVLKTSDRALLTDCTLVGGDSGGPLVSLAGRVIGIHSRIGADLTTNLHVPIDRYQESWDRLVKSDYWGRMQSIRPWIGVVHDKVSASALVQSVESDSPAAQAGILPGDLIVEFDGRELARFEDLKKLVADCEPGESVTVQIKRGESQIETALKIGQRGDEQEHTQTRDDAELLKDWLDYIERSRFHGRAIGFVGKNADQIKDAFKDSLRPMSHATVKIVIGRREIALGTAVDRDGLIVTKLSELDEGAVQCRFSDGSSLPARLVAESRAYDLALLKVERTLDVVDMDQAAVAPPAVGTLLASVGLGKSPLAVGTISGRPRAVPSEARMGIYLGRRRSDPAMVESVLPESAADRAGLKSGDVVLSLNDQAIGSADQLIDVITRLYPGDEVVLRVRRGEEEIELKGRLGRDSEFNESYNEFRDFIGVRLSDRRSGFESVIPHDTVISTRNCGGPVCDSYGRFVGINIARAARTASYLLPSSELRTAVAEMKANFQAAETLRVAH